MATIQDFRSAIKKHKSIILNYPPSGECFPYCTLRFDMDQRGNVREVYTYNKTVYYIAHVDSDELKHRLYDCEGVVSITPTPQAALKKIDETYYEYD